MGRMPAPETLDTAALIAHVLDRFHEGHRRDLPPLIAQAREVAPRVADHLAAMARALEHHMFKEEARLFPMMEQGGHALIGLLVDDLDAEHRAHEVAIEALLALMAEPGAEPLRQPVQRFVDELQAHVRIEDEVLFRRFPRDRAMRPIM